VENIVDLDTKHATNGLKGMVLRFRNRQMNEIIKELQAKIDPLNLEIRELDVKINELTPNN
jgi:hypothetical protein